MAVETRGTATPISPGMGGRGTTTPTSPWVQNYNSHQPRRLALSWPLIEVSVGIPLASCLASGTYLVFLKGSPGCQAKEGDCYMEPLYLAVS